MDSFESEAERVRTLLPESPLVGILGSTALYHADSAETCRGIGEALGQIPELTLITGGMTGVGDAVGRAFFAARVAARQEPQVFHLLPQGEKEWDYGRTLFAGADLSERREVLARIAPVYIVLEGGPGTGHEIRVAQSEGSLLLPVGRSGGEAAALYPHARRSAAIDDATWRILGAKDATPAEVAAAVARAVVATRDRSGLSQAFDVPLESPRHRAVREDSWLGGPDIVAQYRLGRLLERNCFDLSAERFGAVLRAYFGPRMPTASAAVLGEEMSLAALYLLQECRIFEDIVSSRDLQREAAAIHQLASRPDSSDEDLAEELGTTAKTIARITSVRHFRVLVARQRVST